MRHNDQHAGRDKSQQCRDIGCAIVGHDIFLSNNIICCDGPKSGDGSRSPCRFAFPGYAVRTVTGNDARAREKLVTVAKNAPIRATVLNLVISRLQDLGFRFERWINPPS